MINYFIKVLNQTILAIIFLVILVLSFVLVVLVIPGGIYEYILKGMGVDSDISLLLAGIGLITYLAGWKVLLTDQQKEVK